MRSAIACSAVLSGVLSAGSLSAQEPASFKVKGELASVRVAFEAKAVQGAPYSAEIVNESTQILTDGNRIVQQSTGRVYRDSQGRVRREEDRRSGSPAISIVDPAAGFSYSLDPDSHIAWKTPTSASRVIMEKMAAAISGQERSPAQIAEDARRGAEAEQRLHAERRAANVVGGIVEKGSVNEQHSEEVLDPRLIEGVQASGHRRTTTIPSGAIGNDLPITIVSEEWVSPDLNVLVMTHRSDPRSGDSSYRLANINRAEPDPSLFQVPPDYTVRETGINRPEPQQP